MINKILLFVVVGILVWALRYLFTFLYAKSEKKLSILGNASVAFSNICYGYLMYLFAAFSFTFFIPFIINIIGLDKAYFWTLSVMLLIEAIIATFFAFVQTMDYKLRFKINIAFCFGCAFIVHVFNMSIVNVFIKKAYENSYPDDSNKIPVTVIGILIFVFDIIMFVILLIKTKNSLTAIQYAKNRNLSFSSENEILVKEYSKYSGYDEDFVKTLINAELVGMKQKDNPFTKKRKIRFK